jgi:hypothetical protein
MKNYNKYIFQHFYKIIATILKEYKNWFLYTYFNISRPFAPAPYSYWKTCRIIKKHIKKKNYYEALKEALYTNSNYYIYKLIPKVKNIDELFANNLLYIIIVYHRQYQLAEELIENYNIPLSNGSISIKEIISKIEHNAPKKFVNLLKIYSKLIN